jgi:hypothetical protein
LEADTVSIENEQFEAKNGNNGVVETDSEDSLDVIDIEDYIKEKKPVPPGQKYRIKIDKTHYEVRTHLLTGQQLLALAGKTSDKFLLRQKIRGQMQAVLPTQEVDLVGHGVERFVTVPNEVTEGEPSMRRQFSLIEEDNDFLDGLGLPWEAVSDGSTRRIVIRGFSVPDGYTHQGVDLFVILPSGYPDAQIDMAYFYPSLARADGRGIRALHANDFDGLSWQGWSRHRTACSAWRMGVDNLATHITLVSNFLEEELRK